MKKIFFTILAYSVFLTSVAQTEKNVGDFTKVTVFDQIDVTLIKSTENKVVLSGNYANEVQLVNKNGELKIRMPLTKLLKGDNVSATVYFKNIEAVEANEGSIVGSEYRFQTTSFDVIAKEGSTININVAVEKLNVRVANGSTVEISGSATNQDVLVNSGGIYSAQELKTNQTTSTVNAGGEADIYATDFVDAKVRAGGVITIYGKPKQINQKIIAGGIIEEAK